jgi:hypothetical protein
MHPRNDSRLNRPLASLALALLLGVTCLAGGHYFMEKLVESRQMASENGGKKPQCTASPRLAGYGGADCEPAVQLHPMRFR